MLYSYIRSNPLAFRHSLNVLPPYTPYRTVAENVVKNAPCPLPEVVAWLGRGGFLSPKNSADNLPPGNATGNLQADGERRTGLD